MIFGGLAGLLAVAGLVLLRMLAHLRAHSARLQDQRIQLMERLGESQRKRAAVEAEGAVRLAEAAASNRALLDSLPFPVWRRGADLKLVAVNRAYAEAVDADPARAVAEGLELAGDEGRALAVRARDQGGAQSADRHVVMAGTRRFLRLTEVRFADGFLGYASDLTEAETVRAGHTLH